MPTRRPFDHISSTKFRIEIEGVTQGAFTSVDGLEGTTDVVTFVDGSGMDVRKRPGRTTYTNIVLRRGYVNSDELWRWYQRVIDGQVERRAGSIIVCDETLQEIFRYNFYEAWPCRWKGLVMHADVPGTLVEEIEIVTEKVERA